MDNIIKKGYTKSFGEKDLYRVCNGNVNIIQYRNLIHYTHIDEILDPYDCCIILYETEDKYGHFNCITKRGNIIEHFDSLGLGPDKCLSFVDKKIRNHLNEEVPYLSYLYATSGYQ